MKQSSGGTVICVMTVIRECRPMQADAGCHELIPRAMTHDAEAVTQSYLQRTGRAIRACRGDATDKDESRTPVEERRPGFSWPRFAHVCAGRVRCRWIGGRADRRRNALRGSLVVNVRVAKYGESELRA
jgi:hypothetical protein